MRCKKDDSIEQLNLSVKTIFELKRNGIEKIEDLLACNEEQFVKFRHIHHGRWNEIKNAVHALGFIFVDEDISILMEQNNLLEQDISTLGLSLNPLKALLNAKIYTVGDLLSYSSNDLRKLPFIDYTNLKFIKNAIHARGVKLLDENDSLLYERIQNIQIELFLLNKKKIKEELTEFKIEDLNLSNRLYLLLKRRNINTVSDLLSYNIMSLSKVNGLGFNHIQSLIQALSCYGYHFSDENYVVFTKSKLIKEKKRRRFKRI